VNNSEYCGRGSWSSANARETYVETTYGSLKGVPVEYCLAYKLPERNRVISNIADCKIK
jgi:hypothetical protein